MRGCVPMPCAAWPAPSPLPSGRRASRRCSITRARAGGSTTSRGGPRPRGAPRRPGDRRERRPGVSGDLRDAVLLSFDNLGEAADLERGTARAPIGDDPSVTVGLPRALEALAALDLRATFFVEGLNAELYPDALRDIAAAGHEVGLHGWRHEVWDALSPAEEDELLGRGVARARGPRPRGRGLPSARRRTRARGRSRPWPRTVCTGARPRASARGAPAASPACPSAGRRSTPTTDSSPSPTGARLGAIGRTSPRRARPPMRSSAPSTRGATPRSCSSCTPSSCSRSRRRGRRGGCSEHLAGLVARGERWVAPGRELAALVGEGIPRG